MKVSESLLGYKISSLADGFSPLTIQAYLNSLNRLVDFLLDKNVEEITEDDLRRFMGYLRTSYKPDHSEHGELSSASLHRYWKSLRSFFKWAAREKINPTRPDLILSMPRHASKEIIPLSGDDIIKLLKACEYAAPAKTKKRKVYKIHRATADRDKALIMTLLDTGVRVGELTRLTIEDVNLESGEIQIRPYRIGKTRSRIVLIGKSTRKILWKYLQSRGEIKKAASLFVAGSNPMTGYSVLAVLARLGKRAGVLGVHPHRFRHTFAIHYLRNGGDVFTLQRLLGHATLEMVRHYLLLANTDNAEAHRRASPVDRLNISV